MKKAGCTGDGCPQKESCARFLNKEAIEERVYPLWNRVSETCAAYAPAAAFAGPPPTGMGVTGCAT